MYNYHYKLRNIKFKGRKANVFAEFYQQMYIKRERQRERKREIDIDVDVYTYI